MGNLLRMYRVGDIIKAKVGYDCYVVLKVVTIAPLAIITTEVLGIIRCKADYQLLKQPVVITGRWSKANEEQAEARFDRIPKAPPMKTMGELD